MDRLQSEEEKKEFLDILNDMQIRDMQRMYSNLTQRCFTSCINDFKSTNMDKKELHCVENCTAKFLGTMQRVGVRFGTLQTFPSRSLSTLIGDVSIIMNTCFHVIFALLTLFICC
jgi:import inner membrane translocase subunit TIM9